MCVCEQEYFSSSIYEEQVCFASSFRLFYILEKEGYLHADEALSSVYINTRNMLAIFFCVQVIILLSYMMMNLSA